MSNEVVKKPKKEKNNPTKNKKTKKELGRKKGVKVVLCYKDESAKYIIDV